MKYKYHAKCRFGDAGFRANTKSELLSKIRKHYHSKHSEWLKRRIKLGMKRAKAKVGNPKLGDILRGAVSPSWTGFAEKGAIEKITGMPYEQVKDKVTDFLVNMLISGIVKQ